MEYRGWVEVGGIEIDNEDLWSPWLDVLIDRFGRFGPVLGWEENVASVVMSMDAESSGAAARIMFSAVADSLVLRGLGEHFPCSIHVEAISEDG